MAEAYSNISSSLVKFFSFLRWHSLATYCSFHIFAVFDQHGVLAEDGSGTTQLITQDTMQSSIREGSLLPAKDVFHLWFLVLVVAVRNTQESVISCFNHLAVPGLTLLWLSLPSSPINDQHTQGSVHVLCNLRRNSVSYILSLLSPIPVMLGLNLQ